MNTKKLISTVLLLGICSLFPSSCLLAQESGGGTLNLGDYYVDEIPAAISAYATFPETFDLRDLGAVTSVKNQGNYELCWDFAAISSVESNRLLNGYGDIVSDSPDYSEHHLGYFSSNTTAGPIDGLPISYDRSIQQNPYTGGDPSKAARTLSSWIGPISEFDAPYSVDLQPVDDTMFYQSLSHLMNTYSLLSPNAVVEDEPKGSSDLEAFAVKSESTEETRTTAIQLTKEFMMQYGALSVAINANRNYLDYEGNTIYCWESVAGKIDSHEVCLIGWDDTFSRENFPGTVSDGSTAELPPGDGAWIVKNSWGTGCGDEGYFYLSYYDTAMGAPTAFEMEAVPDGEHVYTKNYQYYYGSGTPTVVPLPTATANIFKAEDYETLEAVGITTASGSASTVSIQIYQDPESDNPESGTLVLDQTETMEYAGYHTIPLEKSILLKKGAYFSVVVTSEKSNGKYTYAVECASKDSSTNSVYIEPGESFIIQRGSTDWIDLASGAPPIEVDNEYFVYGNVDIHAFTNPREVQKAAMDRVCFTVYDDKENVVETLSPTAGGVLELPADAARCRLSVSASGTLSINGNLVEDNALPYLIEKAQFDEPLTVSVSTMDEEITREFTLKVRQSVSFPGDSDNGNSKQETDYSRNQNTEKKAAKTGDSDTTALWLGMIFLSIFALSIPKVQKHT